MPEWPADLGRRVDAFAVDRRVQLALMQRWRFLDSDDAHALLELAETLRLGENQLRDFLEWLEETALRDETTIASLLKSPDIGRALERERGRNDAIRAVREALRRLRFPQLTKLEDDLARRVRSLRLPPAVRLVLPPDMQHSEIRLEIRGSDAESLRQAVEALRVAMQQPQFGELFELLAEAP